MRVEGRRRTREEGFDKVLCPQDHFLSVNSFADIIYDNFLFDITRLLDLCSLYCSFNQPLLSKMVTNVFERQPRYRADLQSAIRSVLGLLDRVQQESVGVGSEGRREGAVRLEDVKR